MSSVASALPSISGRASEAGSIPASGTGLYATTEKGFGGAAGFRAGSPTPTESSPSTLFPATSSVSYPNHGPGSVHSQGVSSSRFAKQGAYRPPVTERVLNRAARDKRQQQQSQTSHQAPTSVTHHDGGNESEEDGWEL